MSNSLQPAKHFVQVPMPNWMFDTAKALAKDKAMDLKALLEEFIDNYIESKKCYDQEKDRYVIFYASPANSKPRSIWLSQGHYKKVEAFAQKHTSRINRVVFSACLDGLIANHCVTI
ncbi:hypothetical protein [Thalassomonas actiniarum]|uniref:Uncharacterized protein n=1 Tax=Thalassomonas actiniarum TaxID=485447 RepID=A0AAF0C5D9_9GAMM|nr:hypothetical protein [Thalassomonas actiniarum]WDE00750.1 hypothetical protein SG35_009015 [Thalassomonas actiniarum]